MRVVYGIFVALVLVGLYFWAIDDYITTDRGIMATAAYCAQTIINPDP